MCQGNEMLLVFQLADSFRRIDLVIGFIFSANQRTRPVNGTVLTDLVLCRGRIRSLDRTSH